MARRNCDGAHAAPPPRPHVLEVLVVVPRLWFPHHNGGQSALGQDLRATSRGRRVPGVR